MQVVRQCQQQQVVYQSQVPYIYNVICYSVMIIVCCVEPRPLEPHPQPEEDNGDVVKSKNTKDDGPKMPKWLKLGKK